MDPNQQQTNPDKTKQHPLANYQFSADELRVLKECNTESFFQRSLPLGTSFGLAAFFAVKNGYLKGSVKYGPTPKVVVSVILGYFMGKFSYQGKCAQKMMQLPNSQLAEMLRAKKKGGLYDTISSDTGFGSALSMSPFPTPSIDKYSDEMALYNRSSALNLDTDRPSQDLDDNRRHDTLEEDLALPPAKSQVTYDELRAQNRDEYRKQTSTTPSRNYMGPTSTNPTPNPPTYTSPQRGDDFQPRGDKNQYGDVWTK